MGRMRTALRELGASPARGGRERKVFGDACYFGTSGSGLVGGGPGRGGYC